MALSKPSRSTMAQTPRLALTDVITLEEAGHTNMKLYSKI